ncbi:MAG TPA: hypothetical protein VFI61_03315 [Patescibacteria group bacterium]|nr:hypothetical protein [Patescibacteria group bacterium]
MSDKKYSEIYPMMDELRKAVDPLIKLKEIDQEKERKRIEEIESRFKEISIKAENIHSELLARKKEGLPKKKLTDNGDGTFGLFNPETESAHLLIIDTMNVQSDYTAYFQYRKMEEHVEFQFDKDDKLKQVSFIDVKAMQRNEAHEPSFYEYRTTYKMEAKDLIESQKLVDQLSPRLQPLFDSFNKPEIKPLDQ